MIEEKKTKAEKGVAVILRRVTRLERKLEWLYHLVTRRGGMPWEAEVEGDSNPWNHPEDDVRSAAKKLSR